SLPDPLIKRNTAGRSPSTKEEAFFVQEFSSLLGMEEVFADDDFFKLGGNSIKVMSLVMRASNAGYTLKYGEVFDNPTPEALAKLCREDAGHVSDEGVMKSGQFDPDAEDSNTQRDSQDSKNVKSDESMDEKIEALLRQNTLDAFSEGEKLPLGRVLLCGATGFTGIHVLYEIMEDTDSEVVCQVRAADEEHAARRLDSIYFYYYGHSVFESYPGRVYVSAGDITRQESLASISDIDTVINCAALIKHFSDKDDIEDVNYRGVMHLIEYCRNTGARLVQTSTLGISGIIPCDLDRCLTEHTLNFGQNTADNKYTYSKYRAEEAVLTAVCAGEISAKIMRLGNLTARYPDGEIQLVFQSNGWVNRIRSHYLMGCYPYSFFDVMEDISPIDKVAEAIVKLSQTPRQCTVFHISNPNRISVGDFYRICDMEGLTMKPVEETVYREVVYEGMKNPENARFFTGFLAYDERNPKGRPADWDERYTKQVLLRMGFYWPMIDREYVRRFVDNLKAFLIDVD
ncbi:MAG: SDR family oxidoreductase, partial [Eubacterium sp.]|nr:SDR family oxidoreductase [Eubacterium sp.]